MTTKSMNVKVSTAKLITALEGALAKRQKEVADYKKAKEAYDKEYEAFEKSLIKLVGTNKLTLKSSRIQSWRNDPVEAVFNFEVSPSVKMPKEPESIGHYHNHQIEEILNAISILKMTDDEYVGTSTYKGVAQYL
jgi:argininosuccinate lyase